MDFSVKIGNVELKNPFIIEAGPTTRNGEHIKLAGEVGWGAAVTKTILLKPVQGYSKFIVKTQNGIINVDAASEYSLEEWHDKEFKIAKQGGIPVIANLWLAGPEPWTNENEENVSMKHATITKMHCRNERLQSKRFPTQ